MINKVLLLEDDFALGKVIKDYLNGLGYNTVWTQSGSDAFKQFNTENIELCLIDIGTPDRSGFDVVKDIKELNKNVPVIFISARNQIDDKIRAFQLGADDYLCKPFEIKELELRINAIKFRMGNAPSNHSNITYTIGRFQFDHMLRKLSINGKTTRLSHIDCELLKLLYTNRNTYIKKEVLLRAIWGSDDEQISKRLSVYMNRLRNLLKDDDEISIYNVYGVGYKLQITTAQMVELQH